MGIRGLHLAGQAYAVSIDPKDYRVSPVYGNFEGLGKISVFTGTNDILIVDAGKFKSMMEDASIPFNYFEYPKMFHDWIIITRLKEAQWAINQIAGLINN